MSEADKAKVRHQVAQAIEKARKAISPSTSAVKATESSSPLSIGWLMRHPIVPIIAGWLVTLDGAGNIAGRILALGFLSVWLLADILIAARKRASATKVVSLCGIVIVLEGSALFGAWNWMEHQKHADETARAFIGITASALPSYMYGDQFHILIDISNSGPFDLKQRSAGCTPALITTTGSGVDLYGTPYNSTLEESGLQNIRLKSGESETVPCAPSWFTIKGSLFCGDVLVNVKYSLYDQPSIEHTKGFRFLTLLTPGGLRWVSMPVDAQVKQPCRLPHPSRGK